MFISCEDYYENVLGDWRHSNCEDCFGNKDVYVCVEDFEVCGETVLDKVKIEEGSLFWKTSEPPDHSRVVLRNDTGHFLYLSKDLFVNYFKDFVI